jgi:hypothetical protein
MPSRPPDFDIDDAKSFDANLLGFVGTLEATDPALAAVLRAGLPKLLSSEIDKAALWETLLTAAAESESS